MDEKDFANLIESHKKELLEFMRRKLPIIVGRIAKDHFQENFRKGGFVNGGLAKWAETKRQRSGLSGASTRYGPLLSGREHLFNSINYTPADYRLKVSNNVPYASIYNEGGTVAPTVTPKMRRFASWYMYYKASGKKKNKKRQNSSLAESPEATYWKRLALTKKKKLNIRIPKRQFIGQSTELAKKINDKKEEELLKILKL